MQKTDMDDIYFSMDTLLYSGCWLKINLKKAPSRIVPSVGWSQFLIIVDRGDWKYRLHTKPGYLYDLYREYGHYPQAIYRHCSNTMLQLYNPKPQRPQNFEETWIGGQLDFDVVRAVCSRLRRVIDSDNENHPLSFLCCKLYFLVISILEISVHEESYILCFKYSSL